MTTVLNTTKDQPEYPRKLSELKFKFWEADDIFPNRTVATVKYEEALLTVGLVEGDTVYNHPKMNVYRWRYIGNETCGGKVLKWTEEEINRELEEMDHLFGSKTSTADQDFVVMKATLNSMSTELASLKIKLAEQQEMLDAVKQDLEAIQRVCIKKE